MAFAQLLKALDTLFKNYDKLKLSLARLSEKVFNIRIDPRGQAVNINAFLKDTRSNLSFYLKSLMKMSAALMQEQVDIKKANSQASTARDTMTKLEEHTQATGMLEALEAVIDQLRKQEENKSKSESDGDDNKIIENVLQGASMLVQEITWGLYRYIKEEIRKALDDSEFFTNADALDDEVMKVKESITQLQSACSDNISALDNVMEELCQDGKDDEGFFKSFKSRAETLSKSCDEKLPSVKSE